MMARMKSDGEAEDLQAEIARALAGGSTRGRGYPAPLRERVTTYARECCERGEAAKKIATALGLSTTTLSHWLHGAAATTPAMDSRGAFARVKVVSAKRIVLESPTGWRAEIDVETLARIMAGRR